MPSNPLRIDPSRTATLRGRFISDINKRLRIIKREIKGLIVGQDVFGLTDNPPSIFNSEKIQLNVEPSEWRFLTDDRKLEEFNNWFAQQVLTGVLAVDAVTSEPWLATYVDSAYRKGVTRGFTDVNKGGILEDDNFYEGRKTQFLTDSFGAPEAVSKIRLLYTRAFEDLKGVTATMSAQMSRILAGGLAAGLSPSEISREMNATITQLGRNRAALIARTEVIRAHAEGQLDSFERLGIEEVKALVEFNTAGDERVCPICLSLEDQTFTIEQARGVIPVHPNCRCVWLSTT